MYYMKIFYYHGDTLLRLTWNNNIFEIQYSTILSETLAKFGFQSIVSKNDRISIETLLKENKHL